MKTIAFPRRLLRLLAPAVVVLAGLGTTPFVHAVTDDEISPAGLVGKTFTFTQLGSEPNTLDAFNTYRIQFTSASTFARVGTGLNTQGSFTVLDSSISVATGGRITTLLITTGWHASGNTTSVMLELANVAGTGLYSATEFLNPAKSSLGTFVTGAGGGGAGGPPVFTNALENSATVGVPFSWQLSTAPAATSYERVGGTAPVTIDATSGRVTGTFTSAGTYTFSARASNAQGTSATVTFTVNVTAAPSTPPVISTPPAAQTATAGRAVTFSVVASGTSLSYQWLFNNVAITGATGAAYTIPAVTTSNAGNYSVRVTNSAGTVTSTSTTLTVTPAAPGVAFLSNLSVRARAGSGDEMLIVGVTVGGGTSSKSLLIRGVGPTLGAFGVENTLSDPVLTVLRGTTTITTNDDWGTATGIAATSSAVGAFALQPGSHDSAYFGTGIGSGGYTVQLTGKGGATGNALIELYDTAPADSVTATTARLTNLSARTIGGTGNDTLIVGFNISGTGSRQLVIRAIGPGLAAFGVGGTMADPKLELYKGATKVGENDNWEASSLAVQQSVGAFGLLAGSRDAVLVSTLSTGGYTVQVTGGTTGVVLVEAYEVSALPPPDPVPNPQSRRHAGVDYIPIPGWREEVQGDLLVLRPVSPVTGYPIQVMLLPPLPATGPLEEAAAKAWESVSTRLGTTLTRQTSGLPYMDYDGLQTSFAGFRYVHYRGSLRPPSGSDYLHDLFLLEIGDRRVPVAIIAPEVRDGVYTYQPFHHPAYHYRIYEWIFGLSLEGRSPAGLPVSGRLDRSTPLGGIWAGIALQGGQLKDATLAFFDNGQVFFGSAFPAEGLHERNTWALREQTQRYWGTWRLTGTSGTITMNYGEVPFRLGPDGLILTTNQTDHRYVRLPNPEGAVFDGRYGFADPASVGSSLQFGPDGRFTDQGVLTILEHAVVHQSIADRGGTGTYRCTNHTLLFSFSDGREVRIAFPGLLFTPGDRSPAELVLSSNLDTLVRLR